MQQYLKLLLLPGFLALLLACTPEPSSQNEIADSAATLPIPPEATAVAAVTEADFQWQTEQFADLRILRFQVKGWDNLSLQQKKLVYFLSQAGLAGRDIFWDQNYRHNLAIRQLLEGIYTAYKGDKSSPDWLNFEIYLKRVWHASGIHHHYNHDKLPPGFSLEYFQHLLKATGGSASQELLAAIFDPAVDNKKVELDPQKGLVESSAVNFYAPGLSSEEVSRFYQAFANPDDPEPVSLGLNSRLQKDSNGNLLEQVWKVDGRYSTALDQVCDWLEQAITVAESPAQADALRKLISYYHSGDLADWDDYNVMWLQTTTGDVDYIQGFVETYEDPLALHGAFTNIVQIKDFEATRKMATLKDNAQWFEDHATFMAQHRRAEVTGISYNVVDVASLAGDAADGGVVGVNLPNANWIRAKFGSKSVSLGNIEHAYDMSSGGSYAREFSHDKDELERYQRYGDQAQLLETALHEVIGHASGQIEPGVGQPAETLRNYDATIEEGRADLMALYFMLDPKLVEIGVLPHLDAGKAAYDSYIRSGLLTQLRRVPAGKQIEEAHMRNRAWISRWVMAKGQADNVIIEVERDGKTFFDITNYEKMRRLFGQLLQEVQRIKSQGDYLAARVLVEDYGVEVDPQLHAQVLERAAALGIAPFAGFIQPQFILKHNSAGEITAINLEYPLDFAQQMLFFGREYNLLKHEDPAQ